MSHFPEDNGVRPQDQPKASQNFRTGDVSDEFFPLLSMILFPRENISSQAPGNTPCIPHKEAKRHPDNSGELSSSMCMTAFDAGVGIIRCNFKNSKMVFRFAEKYRWQIESRLKPSWFSSSLLQCSNCGSKYGA